MVKKILFCDVCRLFRWRELISIMLWELCHTADYAAAWAEGCTYWTSLWRGLMYAFRMRTGEGGLLLVFARMVSHIILLSHLESLVKIMFHNVCRVNGCQRQRKIHIP